MTLRTFADFTVLMDQYHVKNPVAGLNSLPKDVLLRCNTVKVYILFKSDRGDSEIQKVVSSKKKAVAWTQEEFEKEVRQERLIDPDEKLDFDLIPEMWQFPQGYSTNYLTVYYEEYYVE